MTVSLEGRVAIVTGGGRGLGRAYALELARRGAAVLVNDLAAEHAEAVAGEIAAAGGRAVVSADSVATPEGGKAIVEAALAVFGTVSAVVSNAAVWRNAPFDDLGPELLDPVLDVHLRGAFFVLRSAWAAMRGAGYGRIVLVSSSAGAFGRAGGANYCAAKAGLLGLGRALALEGAGHGILVNSVLPVARTTPTDPGRTAHSAHTTAAAAAFDALAGRVEPERAAALVAYLASEACTVSGEAFSACGGRYARLVTGLTPGWRSDACASADEIADHFDEIAAPGELVTPTSALDELRLVAAGPSPTARGER